MPSMNILADIQSAIQSLNLLTSSFNEIEYKLKNLNLKNNFLAEKPYKISQSNFTEADECVISAMLKGYITDKEISYFIEKQNLKKSFNSRHQVTKLMTTFNAVTRGDLLRKLIAEFS
jgi:hypothetical protein